METLWTIELLGGLRAARREETIARFRTRKAAALLACLAFRLGQTPPTRDSLIEILWPESDPDAALARLAVELSALRKQLEPPGVPRGAVVLADRFTISLDPAVVTTDLIAFESTLRRANATAAGPERTRLLGEAVRDYGGALLPEIDGDWIAPERERLATRFLSVASGVVEELLQRGSVREAGDIALIAAQRERQREAGHVLRMRCALAAHEPEEALRRFEELTRILRESSDEAPGAEARRLASEARRLSSAPAEASGVVSPSTPTTGEPKSTPSNAPSVAVTVSERTASVSPSTLPLGIAAILATDIEGSTSLGRSLGDDGFAALLERHHALMRAEFGRCGGLEFQEGGDGFWVAFPQARDALSCACACQCTLEATFAAGNAEGLPPLKVRMAIHVADLRFADFGKGGGAPGSYRGLALHDLSRLLSATNGGQIFVSEAAHGVLRRDLPAGISLRDLGRFRLRDGPGPESIHAVIWSSGDTAESRAPRAARARTPILPPTLTRFFGRADEIDAIADMLGDPGSDDAPRLLSLTGLGGSGKTRLAIEAARRLGDGVYSGAVWFVPLAETMDPAVLLKAIRGVVAPEAAQTADHWDALAATFANEPALLVLDNLEHLLDGVSEEAANAVPELLEDLLLRFSALTCLTTTRKRVGLAAEHEFPVRPLPIAPVTTPGSRRRSPAASAAADTRTQAEQVLDFAGVALFVDRARRARFDFQVTERNAESVAALCARLEGIPLALELAAAWARVLTPTEMLAQFQSVRQSRDRSVPARHRSLDAAIAGSYRLLDDNLRRAFRALSVFRGGWTLEAARAVIGDDPPALALLSDLCDRSLVQAEAQGESTRYGFLETVREFASARLAEDAEQLATARHLQEAYFIAFASQARDGLQGPDQARWLGQLGAEHGNITSALERLGRAQRLIMAVDLYRYWIFNGYLPLGRLLLSDVLVPNQGDVPENVLNKAINVAGVLAQQSGDVVSAQSLFEEYAKRCRLAGHELGAASAAVNLAIICSEKGDHLQAKSLYESTMGFWRSKGDSRTFAAVLSNAGAMAHGLGETATARLYLEESLGLQGDDGDPLLLSNTLQNLCMVSFTEGDLAASAFYISEAFKQQIAHGNLRGMAGAIESMAGLFLKRGQLDLSARVHGIAASVGIRLGVSAPPAWQEKLDAQRDELQVRMGATDFARAWNAGYNATWEDAISALQQLIYPDVKESAVDVADVAYNIW